MILGIDLGTTNSLAAVFRDGQPELIPNVLGSMLTPSVVSLDDDGAPIVGLAARERQSTHPDRTVGAFKRAMGTNHVFPLGKSRFRAEELSAFVLSSLKADAERTLGESLTQAVITVPAYFSDAQRRATRAAGQLAGLEVLHLLNEPTAAALAYGLHAGAAEQRILVLDLGGGTFDVSLLDMFEGVMEVRATAGDNILGGEDFTAALMDGFLAAVGQGAGLPPRKPEQAVHAGLRRAAEVAKRALTGSSEHTMTVAHRNQELSWVVTRDQFDGLAAPLLARIRSPVERAIRDSRLTPDDIGHIVLAGGATRMPMFRRLVARMFQRLPVATVNPDEVVARGAAVQAGLVGQDTALADRVMTDVAPYSMGVETAKASNGQVVAAGLYSPVIERNTIVPASRSINLQTLSDGQRAICVRVFQGEARQVIDNIPLGELNVPVPVGRAGQHRVDVRFTYDTSGVLEVEAKVATTGTTRRVVIENQPGVLTPADIAARLDALAPLKIHPREQAENLAIIARAERLFAERVGDERTPIAAVLDRFLVALASQDPKEIARVRDEVSAWLDLVDTSYF